MREYLHPERLDNVKLLGSLSTPGVLKIAASSRTAFIACPECAAVALVYTDGNFPRSQAGEDRAYGCKVCGRIGGGYLELTASMI